MAQNRLAVGLRSHCHSVHSALPDLLHTEIKGCGRSFTSYSDSKALKLTKKPTLPSAGQPLTGWPLTGTGKSLQWPNLATPFSAAALRRSPRWTGLPGACTAPQGLRKAQGKPALLEDHYRKQLQTTINIISFHGKPHTKNLRERDQGSHPDNQHVLLQVCLSNLKMGI